MKIYRYDDMDRLCLKNTAVALGEFDSIHIGHIEIIEKTVSVAREKGLLSVVLMFENNPLDFILKRSIMPVNTLNKRFEILEKLGVDVVIALKFDKEIMEMTHIDFFEKLLMEKLDSKYLSVGFNYHFGKGGKGDAKYLKKACESRGVILDVTDEVKLSGDTVSSTRIRELISEGKVDTAAELLGRPFSVQGVVVKGNQLGGKLFGFPTANIEMPDKTIVPQYGVYISKVKLRDKVYEGITNVGAKPTVSKEVGIESHILNKEFGPLYGEDIEIYFYKYIRDIIAFENSEGLTKRLEEDKKEAINYFKGV